MHTPRSKKFGVKVIIHGSFRDVWLITFIGLPGLKANGVPNLVYNNLLVNQMVIY